MKWSSWVAWAVLVATPVPAVGGVVGGTPRRSVAVTIDNDEYVFAFVYADTLRRGGRGISWLHRRETTAGKPRSPSPDRAAWIQQACDALPRR